MWVVFCVFSQKIKYTLSWGKCSVTQHHIWWNIKCTLQPKVTSDRVIWQCSYCKLSCTKNFSPSPPRPPKMCSAEIVVHLNKHMHVLCHQIQTFVCWRVIYSVGGSCDNAFIKSTPEDFSLSETPHPLFLQANRTLVTYTVFPLFTVVRCPNSVAST